MTLEEKQEESRERQKIARSKQNSKNAAGRRKKTRSRSPSIESVLLAMAHDPRVTPKQRIEAADRYCLLTGRPVLPAKIEEKDAEEPGTVPTFRGSELGEPKIAPRAGIPVDAGQ